MCEKPIQTSRFRYLNIMGEMEDGVLEIQAMDNGRREAIYSCAMLVTSSDSSHVLKVDGN